MRSCATGPASALPGTGGATSAGRSRSPVFARTHNRNHAQAGVSLLESDTLRWTETRITAVPTSCMVRASSARRPAKAVPQPKKAPRAPKTRNWGRCEPQASHASRPSPYPVSLGSLGVASAWQVGRHGEPIELRRRSFRKWPRPRWEELHHLLPAGQHLFSV